MGSGKLASLRQKNALYARLRGRQFASLEHLCGSHNLLYCDIYKRDTAKLQATLSDWQCDLVITSGCSFVPLDALTNLSHGAINMHPSGLPGYRGGEPILWQIVDKEMELATSIHRLTDKFDCGAVLAQKRITRPHAATKAALLNITDGVLGRELLSSAIEMLTANPMSAGVEQPKESPTRSAPGRSPERFADEFGIDSFSAQTLWDLIHYFGYCPHPWLALSGWRKLFEWRPVRMYEQAVTTDITNWQINKAGSTVFLHSDQATIELKPRYASVHRLLRN